ncbi:hypothetical protein KOR42_48040 [Thalassoglobus neptunius]|uniref:Uncharacterized protein n=1 Tax=Thalassoglobus neptunius TaxID=1938619 RepID=A0A5C5VV19_9PLAN|nr:hypothetical protein [Thalassoglobus neptunius]TWT41451.1 hypothetical protein KOR42_48040 [Thalassoglobus neptunius]
MSRKRLIPIWVGCPACGRVAKTTPGDDDGLCICGSGWLVQLPDQQAKELNKPKLDGSLPLTELSADMARLWDQSERLGKEIARLKRIRDACKGRVLGAIGDAKSGGLPDGRVIQRVLVTRKAHTVPESTYVTVRVRKPSPNRAKK